MFYNILEGIIWWARL